LLGQAFCISGSGTSVVVLMPSRPREVADFRSGAPSRRAIRRAQTFFLENFFRQQASDLRQIRASRDLTT